MSTQRVGALVAGFRPASVRPAWAGCDSLLSAYDAEQEPSSSAPGCNVLPGSSIIGLGIQPAYHKGLFHKASHQWSLTAGRTALVLGQGPLNCQHRSFAASTSSAVADKAEEESSGQQLPEPTQDVHYLGPLSQQHKLLKVGVVGTCSAVTRALFTLNAKRESAWMLAASAPDAWAQALSCSMASAWQASACAPACSTCT